jgi:hypothetical protein
MKNAAELKRPNMFMSTINQPAAAGFNQNIIFHCDRGK